MGGEMEFMLVLLPARLVDGDDFMILYRTWVECHPGQWFSLRQEPLSYPEPDDFYLR